MERMKRSQAKVFSERLEVLDQFQDRPRAIKGEGTVNAAVPAKSASNSCIREWEKSGESVSVAHWFGNSGNPPSRAE